jgi:hypothetical protein
LRRRQKQQEAALPRARRPVPRPRARRLSTAGVASCRCPQGPLCLFDFRGPGDRSQAAATRRPRGVACCCSSRPSVAPSGVNRPPPARRRRLLPSSTQRAACVCFGDIAKAAVGFASRAVGLCVRFASTSFTLAGFGSSRTGIAIRSICRIFCALSGPAVNAGNASNFHS